MLPVPEPPLIPPIPPPPPPPQVAQSGVGMSSKTIKIAKMRETSVFIADTLFPSTKPKEQDCRRTFAIPLQMHKVKETPYAGDIVAHTA